MDDFMCFFSTAPASHGTPSEPYIVGTIDVLDPATGRGQFSGETMEQIRQRHPDVQLIGAVEAERLREEAVITGPKRIDAERFKYLMEVLPPCKHALHDVSESFHVSERFTGQVVTWAVRIHDCYFELRDRASLKHVDVLEACMVEYVKQA